jgi:hypothetical protein
LCHGDLGNLELLLQASQVLEEPQWHAQVDRIAAIILTPTDMEQVNLCFRTWSPGSVCQKVLFSEISARHIPFGQIRPCEVTHWILCVGSYYR